jgi:hypothetical protein
MLPLRGVAGVKAADICCCYLGHERVPWMTLYRECPICAQDMWKNASGSCGCRRGVLYGIESYVLTNHKFRAFPTHVLQYVIELDPSLGPPPKGHV